MIKKNFFLFIFFAPFTSFFAFSAWLRIPVIINQVLLLIVVLSIFIHGRLKNKWVLKEDLLLLVVLVFVWLSFFLGFKEQRSFNHSLAYTNSIIFYFFLSKYIIKLFDITSLEISKIVYKSFVACSLIILIDFIGKNFFDFNLRDIYSSVDGVISNMNYYVRYGMYSVGGVAEEPGHMANFYNIYFGITLYYIYLKKDVKKYKWVISLFILSQIALFSSAGIVLSLFAVFLISVYDKMKKLTITKKQLFWLSLISAFFLIILLSILLYDVNNLNELNNFLNKITFNDSSEKNSSSGARINQWSRALVNFLKNPILGNGPGYGVNEDSEGYLSVYLTILSDIGIIAFFAFILFQLNLISKTFKIKGYAQYFILFSILTSFIHLFIIADFYQAPIWILFVFIQIAYKEQKLDII